MIFIILVDLYKVFGSLDVGVWMKDLVQPGIPLDLVQEIHQLVGRQVGFTTSAENMI